MSNEVMTEEVVSLGSEVVIFDLQLASLQVLEVNKKVPR